MEACVRNMPTDIASSMLWKEASSQAVVCLKINVAYSSEGLRITLDAHLDAGALAFFPKESTRERIQHSGYPLTRSKGWPSLPMVPQDTIT